MHPIDMMSAKKRIQRSIYPNPNKVRELSVGIDVHLNNTVVDSGLDLVWGRARATMENEVPSTTILGKIHL